MFACLLSKHLFPALARTLEQFVRLDVQGRGELLDHIDARTVHAAFEQADICAVDACEVSQFLLRETFGLPVCLQIEREDFPDVHIPRMRRLSSIQPRSILLKIEVSEIRNVGMTELLVSAGSARARGSLPSNAGLADTVEVGIHA